MKNATPALCALMLCLSLTGCAPTAASPSDAATDDARPDALWEEINALRRELEALSDAVAALDTAPERVPGEKSAPAEEPPRESLPTENRPAAGEASLSVAPPYVYTVEEGEATIVAYCAAEGGKVILPAELDGHPVVAVGAGAFRGAPVTAVAVAPGVSHIGAGAFAGCAALRAVTLPASVTAIAAGAFDDCPALTIYCARGSVAAMLAEANGWRCIEV